MILILNRQGYVIAKRVMLLIMDRYLRSLISIALKSPGET
jgi:hypothetical protein